MLKAMNYIRLFVFLLLTTTHAQASTAFDSLVNEVFEITNNRLKVIKIIALAKSAIRNNLGEELNGIKQPTCLIWGNNDTITPPFVGKEFHRLIPNSELYFVDKMWPDFTIDDLKIWDYKRWAKSAIETIEKVIDPLRDRMISYDIALNKIRDRIKKDSVSVVSELIQLEDRLLYSQLQKFDPDPLPIAIFEMKKAEMKYQSDVISHKPTRDSSNIMLKLSYLTSELADIQILDSITSKLVKRDLDKEGSNYHHFINKAYGTKAVLSSLINTTQDFMNRVKLRKEIEWEATIQATKWAINGSDSIPLFFEQSRDLNFKPLVIVDEKFTIGLAYKDSLASGYFYSITPTRIPDVKATFTVDQSSFTKRNLPLIKCISLVEPSGQVFFSVIFSESKTEDKFPVTITKIYKSDGLAWSNNYRLDLLPTELTYAADSGELSIKTSAGGDSKIIVLDKNGKQVQ